MCVCVCACVCMVNFRRASIVAGNSDGRSEARLVGRAFVRSLVPPPVTTHCSFVLFVCQSLCRSVDRLFDQSFSWSFVHSFGRRRRRRLSVAMRARSADKAIMQCTEQASLLCECVCMCECVCQLCSQCVCVSVCCCYFMPYS